MTCREFADFMADYLSGELPAHTRTLFDEHLSVCPNCVAYLANYEKAVALGQRVLNDDEGGLPSDVPDHLVQAILAAWRR